MIKAAGTRLPNPMEAAHWMDLRRWGAWRESRGGDRGCVIVRFDFCESGSIVWRLRRRRAIYIRSACTRELVNLVRWVRWRDSGSRDSVIFKTWSSSGEKNSGLNDVLFFRRSFRSRSVSATGFDGWQRSDGVPSVRGYVGGETVRRSAGASSTYTVLAAMVLATNRNRNVCVFSGGCARTHAEADADGTRAIFASGFGGRAAARRVFKVSRTYDALDWKIGVIKCVTIR